MPAHQTHQIMVATFPTPDGASQAAAAVTGVMIDKIAGLAVIRITPEGRPQLEEPRRSRVTRNARVTTAIAAIGGPTATLADTVMPIEDAGQAIGWFDRARLTRLSHVLQSHTSAIVLDVVADAAAIAPDVVSTLRPSRMLTFTMTAGRRHRPTRISTLTAS